MSTKITAPAAASMTGEFVNHYGPVTLLFRDGVAEYPDELPLGVQAYLRLHGYGIDGEATAPEVTQPLVDARDVAEQTLIGTPLRDAAVDPQLDDFLAPVNAGEGDPHGALVVAPGIHAEGERVVASGPVFTDPAAQEQNEKRLAEKLLVDNEQVTPPVDPADFLKEGGPLGMSDPGSVEAGVAAAEAGEQYADAGLVPGADAAEPKGNAGLKAWQAYARLQGATDDQLEGKSRDDLRAEYGS